MVPAERTEESWYLLQLKPGRWRVAADNLARQGVETFLPLRLIERRRLGRVQRVKEPAFPGYMFARFDPGRLRWRSLNSTYGVSKVVMLEADRPAAVPAGLVEELRLRCDDAGYLKAIDDLRPGDLARIASGPFADLMCNIDKLSGGDMVRVLLALMGQTVAVTLPREALIRLTA
jgi:transcriptional antiterminator RfaH